jgi:diguanylate cyclase (GGDEF)-like protein/PAS domain S-box-containing protein
MRISTKLTSVIVLVFLIVGVTSVLGLERLRGLAHVAVESEAVNVATAIASMAGYERSQAGYQELIDFATRREERDLEIFDHKLVVIADVHKQDVGTPIEESERKAVVTQTLKDGVARTMQGESSGAWPGARQVVVPIYDKQQRITAVLAYEYTPLYRQLEEQARQALGVVAGVAGLGLLFAIGCALYVSRVISAPMRQLSAAALRLSQGERNVTVDLQTHDEIGDLAKSFNTMSKALQASEASLHLRERAIESSFNAIMIASLTQQGYPIEYVNVAFTRITGYTPEETIGQGVNFLVNADQHQPEFQEIRRALRERREGHAVLRSYRKDGRPFWNEVYVAPVRNDEGEPEYFIAILNDITDARNDAEQLAHQAHFDALTGLANRTLLLDRLRQAIMGGQRRRDQIVLAFIDLDGFKLVNDNLGHHTGDELLKIVATRLQSSVRASDTVARMGGDKFILLLHSSGRHSDIALASHITELVRRVLDNIVQPVLLDGEDVRVSCSIGLASYPQDGGEADILLKNAEAAMYGAKELGRNRFQFFTADLQERARRQLQLGASLRQALERNEFELHYQPQVSLRSGKVVGLEALLRWRHPTQGLIGPGQFIGYAEESGLIIPIGEWVLQQACAQNKAWQDAGLPAIPVAVNVSARQCAQDDLEATVRRALHKSGLAPRFLELELTESLSMADPERSVPLMEAMKEIGVEISIDDFGTGYSNMSYLKRFPIDRLKLDISFVRDITTDPGSLAISNAIITMSHSLHLEVVAEGVETEGQLALLAARGCDIVQGYYFSKPLPAPDLEQLLREGKCLPAGESSRPALLILDDDPHLLAYFELLLAPDGYTILSTVSPQHAFELLARNEIAVLLCDQRMPEMNGVDFLSRVKRMYPATVRIMLSAYDDFNATRQAINMGAVYKFIEKPVQPDELREAVGEAYSRYLDARQLQEA